MRVGEERDVGDRGRTADKEVASRKVRLEQIEAPLPVRSTRVDQLDVAPGQHEEARRAHAASDPFLFELQPLHDARAAKRIGGQTRGTFTQVPENGIRLDDHLAAANLQDRRLSGWIEAPVLIRQRVAREDVDGDTLVGPTQ